MDKPILITGGAGYIGSHTVVALVQQGYYPVIADDFRNSYRKVLDGIKELIGFEPPVFEIDICDQKELELVFEKFDFKGIIHFAADKAVGESVQHPLKYYHNNIGGLVSLLSLAQKFKIENIVFSSSCTVYGEISSNREVKEEDTGGHLNSPYGVTKWIGEQILQDFQVANPEFKIINLRYFNPIGAHPSGLIGEYPIGRPNNLLPFITQTAIGKQDQLKVFGNDYPTPDGTCIRDYIHVCDLAEAHVHALHFIEGKTQGGSEAVNVGTGRGTSILEVIQLFEEISEKPLNWKFEERRPGDVASIYANAEKAKKLLNWEAHYTVKDAIEHAWKWEINLNNEN